MDLFSHVAASWIFAEKLPITKKEKQVLIVGGILPDLDFFVGMFLYLFVDHDMGRNFHRGIMHTFFFGILYGLFLFFALKSVVRKRIFLSGFFGVGLHCLIDQIITYSFKYPKIFYPLSNTTFALNQIGTCPLVFVYIAMYVAVWLSAFILYKKTSRTPLDVFRTNHSE